MAAKLASLVGSERARLIQSAMVFMSASFMPRVVTAGVPSRMPPPRVIFSVSKGMPFLLHGDRRLIEGLTGDLAVEALRTEVDEHEVVVRATADDAETVTGHGSRERLGVLHDLLLILHKAGLKRLMEATALAAMTCMRGPPWTPGKTWLLIFLISSSLFVRIMPPRGPRRDLCVVVVTKSAYSIGEGCTPAGDETGDVSHIDEQVSAHAFGDLAHAS